MMLVTMLVQTSFGNNTQTQILLHLRQGYLRNADTVATNKKIKKHLTL